MIRFIFIALAVLLLLFGGMVGLIYFRVVPDFTGVIIPAVTQVKDTIVAQLPGADDPQYMDAPPVTVAVVVDGRVVGNLYLAFRYVMATDKVELIERRSAQLRSVYLLGMQRLINAQMTQRRTPDVLAIKKNLKELTEKIVGPGVIKDVLIQELYLR